MPTDLIRYDLLVQDALRSVVRRVLADTARDGLLGDHHFYVTFRTNAIGVRLSARLRSRYPDEMTIILQHQFWDLEVTEQTFQVGLSFGGTAELLVVPFDAVTGFFDPSVQFGLKFEVQDTAPEEGANDAAPAKVPAQKFVGKSSGKAGEAPRTPVRGAGAEPTMVPPKEPAASPGASGKAATATKQAEKKPEKASASTTGGAKVVAIDSFRKKT